MAEPAETIWEADLHTHAKLDILRNYLQAWFAILGNSQFPQLTYIDGFSGPGVYKKGEQGSPVIAVDVASQDLRAKEKDVLFLFIEKREDRYNQLKKEVKKLGTLPQNFDVYYRHKEFKETIPKYLIHHRKERRMSPLLVFVDPYGFSGIPYAVMKEILELRSSEIFINFAVQSMNRFFEEKNVKESIIETFGDEKVITECGESINSMNCLREKYQEKLENIARYVRYFEISDSRNVPIYYLFFATNNEKGFEKMKDAMWKVDPTGSYRFTDKTNPNQSVMLVEESVNATLSELLQNHFSDRETVLGEEVEEYVIQHTIFRKKHKTQVLNYMEFEEKNLIVDKKKKDGSIRKTGYPPLSILRFVK